MPIITLNHKPVTQAEVETLCQQWERQYNLPKDSFTQWFAKADRSESARQAIRSFSNFQLNVVAEEVAA